MLAVAPPLSSVLALVVAVCMVSSAQGQVGACCLDELGTCAMMTEQDCDAAAGRFQGVGTECASVVCERYVRTLRGSGSAAGIGQFIDIMPEFAGGESILITGFDYHVTTSSGVGAPLMLDVWVHRGTYREAESYDPAEWVLHETLHGVSVGGGPDVPVHVTLNTPILAQAGATTALFLHSTLGTMQFRTNVQRNPTIYDNGELRLYSERYRFGAGGGGWNGTLREGRDFHGAVYYIPADGSEMGACCLPTGTCAQISVDACTAQGGRFTPGADCASVVCQGVGVCCWRDGMCSIEYEEDCMGRYDGDWYGPGTSCANIDCFFNSPGACCFDASLGGGCVLLRQTECAAAGGTYHGDHTRCADGDCWSAPVLWNNGPVATGDTVGGTPAPAGTLFSEVQPGNTLLGANAYRIVLNVPGGFTIADDFEILSPGGWFIDDLTVYAFRQHTAGGTFTKGYLEIWDGPPHEAGSSVVFGDQATNRLLDSTFAGIYRVEDATPTLNRHVNAVRLNVQESLPPGRYWLRYSLEVEGNEAIGNMSPFVTMRNVRGPVSPSAVQSLGGVFYPLWDDVNLPLVGQELPFVIRGESLTAMCYANCDGSTVPPVLNVDDFTCFINEFAAASVLPHAQQVVAYANCDGSTMAPPLNVDDFTCFINEFAAGCP